MGGTIKKVFGGGAATVVPEARASAQSVIEKTVGESEDRNTKRNTRQGKKKLQIPGQSTAVGTGTSGGTGLGLGA